MIKLKDLEHINMLQVMYIKGIGNKINIMAKDKFNLRMDQNMKDDGKIIKCMVKED